MRKAGYIVISILVGFAAGIYASLWYVQFQPIEAAEKREVDMLRSSAVELQYGPEAYQLADVVFPHPYSEPGNQEAPLIIWLHWSGFTGADKSVIEPFVLEFAKRTGLVCLSINYHLGTEADPCWPQAGQDITQAIDFARNGDGMPCVSRDAPVYLVGYSAGGTLAAKYALEHPGEVAAVAMVGGILDFSEWALLHPESEINLVCGFGPGWQDYCPSAQMDGDHCPILAMHGTLDNVVEAQVNASIVGCPNFRLVEIGGGTHDCNERLNVVLAEILKAFLG